MDGGIYVRNKRLEAFKRDLDDAYMESKPLHDELEKTRETLANVRSEALASSGLSGIAEGGVAVAKSAAKGRRAGAAGFLAGAAVGAVQNMGGDIVGNIQNGPAPASICGA